MGHRELLLVLVSIVLLTALMTQINTNIVEGREALQELEIGHTAAAVAQQFIEGAKAKKFDEQVGIIDPTEMPNKFTDKDNLGPEGEVYPNFDDVDDYHSFDDTLFVNQIDFRVQINVSYVKDDTNLEPASKSFYKLMRVRVTSSWLPNSVILRHVFTYFGVNL